MDEPVVELIAADMADKINAIVAGSEYYYTLRACRAKHFDFLNEAWADLDVIIKQFERELISSENMTSRWEQPFAIAAIALQSDSASTSIDTKNNRIAADIEKKLMADCTRGGNATDTKIDGVVPFKSPKGQTGVWMEVTVYFSTVENDPYTKG